MHPLKHLINDPSRIIEGTAIDAHYLTDGLKHHIGHADWLLFPLDSAEIVQIMRYANQHKIAVTTRGAGTNLVGSTLPQGGIVLDLSRMDKIIELDKETFTLTVEPGVLLETVQQYVEQEGFFYPPDPGAKRSTIGGNISTNAGGMRAVKYGVTRDYVLALEVVLANGDIIEVGSKNLKDNTGLSLINLFVGSEGTLGIITRCTLKLIALPQVSETVIIGFDSIEQAVNNVVTVLKTITPAALEFVERTVVEWGEHYSKVSFPLAEAKAYLIVMLDGADHDEVNKQRQRLLTALPNVSYAIPANKQETQAIWSVRGSLVRAVEAVSEQEPIDIVVPINRIADFVSYTKQLSAETAVRMIAFGHAGDGNIHLCLLRDGRDLSHWQITLAQVLAKLYTKCVEFKGLPSAEHGIGTAKVHYYEQALAPENRLLMQRVKAAFDPLNLLNNQVYQHHH